MAPRSKSFLLAIFLLRLTAHRTSASNILGFAAVGARSHQLTVLRTGQELASRGHNFTLLLSSEEGLDLQGLGSKAFDGLNVVMFKGPVGIGTQDWFANQPRDAMKVALASTSS